ncbi:MAG: GYF domain-containing protein [Pseudomonadota bacterium]
MSDSGGEGPRKDNADSQEDAGFFSEPVETSVRPQADASGESAPVSGPPPHPLDAQWHVSADGKVYGPYSGHDFEKFVQEGRVDAMTNVCRVGSEKWQRAGDDKTLGALFAKSPPRATASRTVQAGEGSAVVQINNVYPDPALVMGPEIGPKSPGIALLLSLLITGVGQMYNGQVAKGILMLIGCILLWVVWLGWVIWIWAMIDAYQEAKHINYQYHQRATRRQNG